MTAVMPTYRRICNFVLFIHLIILSGIYKNNIFMYSTLISVRKSEYLGQEICMRNNYQLVIQGQRTKANIIFTTVIGICFMGITFATWLSIILLCSGDIHPNPGPSSMSSSSSSMSSSSNMSTSMQFSLSNNLSFVHYNVQSIVSKLDILHSELFDFDVLAFTETWLNPSVDSDDLTLLSYNKPERKDRVGDNHGGVMLYVKEALYYKRRADLEIGGIESIWIELVNHHKHILFGLFYRPPNSDANYYANIENSISLAVDTGITDILITGDFNLNLLNPQTARKIHSFCTIFSLYQSINQPTHFTENSSSLIDIVLVSNKDSLILSGVGEPFLNQELRYHCPVYGILKFSKPKQKTFTRHIWNYEKGNYNLLRNTAATTNWTAFHDNDIDVYANNLNTAITKLAQNCIPNRSIRIYPSDPPWITSFIKSNIRKRKRAYRRAKRTNLTSHWSKFKRLRNNVVSMIRDAKTNYYDKIADKLKSDTLSAKDWWSTLKTVISPNSKTSIPALESNDIIYSNDRDKA
ncbi:MAG: endonuclease/exonuclease/phosphatase family protein, partial [Candidatus Thiodiazotropha sp.]